MSWRDLLDAPSEVTLPWLGGATLEARDRTFRLANRPREHGWYRFAIEGKSARTIAATDPDPSALDRFVTGYLVGDRIVVDGARIDPDPTKILGCSERVHLISEAIDRFGRVRAGRVFPEGPLVFAEQAFPLGPEDAVLAAYFDRETSLLEIRDVTPALDAAFRMESLLRERAEERRRELERLRAEQEAQRIAEQRRRELYERLGSGAGRRELARVDFEQAARAALAIGGAEYLDHRRNGGFAGEWIVRYRLAQRRFECVCNDDLRIVDAGVCLTSSVTGERGDTYFTLESLPGVILEAIEEDVLHVRRHV